jgi:hypothetical protein
MTCPRRASAGRSALDEVGVSQAPLEQRLQCLDQLLAPSRWRVKDLHRRTGEHRALDQPLALELTQSLGQHPVGDALDQVAVLPEAPGSVGTGQQDDPGARILDALADRRIPPVSWTAESGLRPKIESATLTAWTCMPTN